MSSQGSLPAVAKQSVSHFAEDVQRIVFWTPAWCRWNPNTPKRFSLALNLLFGLAGAFTVANLYYSHPILNILADSFNVPYNEVAQIPTLAQAGYVVGLFFLCPLGDLFPRRHLVLLLIFLTATISIGLCVSTTITSFSAIQFLVGLFTVTPQLMMPLVGELAPPDRRASAVSIVMSGVMLGVLLARLLAGIVTLYASWHNIYWLSVGCQYIILIFLWLTMPDYPSANPEGLNYFSMLCSTLTMLTKHPVLVQACTITLFISAIYTNFWTVLTFLLAEPPYQYNSLEISLLALVGIASLLCGPLFVRLVTDKYTPLLTVFIGLAFSLAGCVIGTFTGKITIVGPIIQAFVMDLGVHVIQIANRAEILPIEPRGRNRVNTSFMVFTFCGQLAGTAIGSRVYSQGGWLGSGCYSIGSIVVGLLIALMRGPRERGWVGWRGGWSIQKRGDEETSLEQPDVGSEVETSRLGQKDGGM